jgi:hypothetical protein
MLLDILEEKLHLPAAPITLRGNIVTAYFKRQVLCWLLSYQRATTIVVCAEK